MRGRLGQSSLQCTLTLTLVLLGTMLWIRPFAAQAVPDSLWLSEAAPQLEVFSGESPIDRPNYNLDCAPERGITRHADTGLFGSTVTTEKTIHGCATRALYGVFNSGYLRLNNTGLHGLLRETVVPIPNSTTVLRYHQGTPTIGSAYLILNYVRQLDLHKLDDGQVQYNLKPHQAIFLKDGSGQLLNLNYSSITFSRNGQWLAAVAGGRLIRFNLITYEVQYLDTSAEWLGDSARPQTAISNNGRYVAVASSWLNRFRIYDLQSCSNNQCNYRDLLPQLPAPARNGSDHLNLRFLSDRVLSFYRRDQVEADTTWNRMLFTAGGQVENNFDYLALGDSFASGEGAYDYRPETAQGINNCHVSNHSYSYLIKSSLSFGKAGSVACSGAVIRDIFEQSPLGINRSPGLTETLAQLLPGYLPQADFQFEHFADVITVSIGGNNIGFGRKLFRCIEADTCFSSFEDRLEVVREINNKFDSLAQAFRQLRETSPPTTKIYAIGYPEFAKAGGDCAWNVHLDSSEVEFSNQVIRYLNQMIGLAARKAGVFYVDVGEAFYGHRFCETDQDHAAINGLTVGDDHIDWGLLKGPFGSESYHPNQLGHRLLKDRILSLTSNLATAMPTPDVSTEAPGEDLSLEMLQAPRTGRPIYLVNYDDDLSNNVIVRNGLWGVVVETGKALLRPFSALTGVLHSEPISLGTFTSDENGGFAAQVFIPASVPPGYHTLHLYGENPAGEPVDIQKVVYVATSTSDLDGDGVPNGQDSCVTLAENATEVCVNSEPASASGSVSQNVPGAHQSVSLINENLAVNTVKQAVVADNPAPKELTPKSTRRSLFFWPLPIGLVSIFTIRRLHRA